MKILIKFFLFLAACGIAIMAGIGTGAALEKIWKLLGL